MIQVATDNVFDGSLDRPYREDDPVGLVGANGAGKIAGEYAGQRADPRSVVPRTAWVLSRHRSSFIKIMLQPGTERSELSVVADQRVCPTSAADIAGAVGWSIPRGECHHIGPIPHSCAPAAQFAARTGKLQRDFSIDPRPWRDAVDEMVCHLHANEGRPRK